MDTRGVTLNTGISAVADNDRNTVDRLWVRRAQPIISGTLFKYTDFFYGRTSARDKCVYSTLLPIYIT